MLQSLTSLFKRVVNREAGDEWGGDRTRFRGRCERGWSGYFTEGVPAQREKVLLEEKRPPYREVLGEAVKRSPEYHIRVKSLSVDSAHEPVDGFLPQDFAEGGGNEIGADGVRAMEAVERAVVTNAGSFIKGLPSMTGDEPADEIRAGVQAHTPSAVRQ